MIVDDSDNRIQWTGKDWFDVTTDNQLIKNGTLSESEGVGSFAYWFIGTSCLP